MNGPLTPDEGIVTIRAVLADAERRLAAAGVPSPAVDAAELLALVRGVRRNRLLMSDPVPDVELVRFESLLLRRAARVPLQHLTGMAGFRRLDLQVGPGVFVPRPETELVAEVALRTINAGSGRQLVLDLCAGSGAIGLAIATEACDVDVIAVEIEPSAVEWAERNAASLGVKIAERGSTYRLILADAGELGQREQPLAEIAGRVDIVVANPPYIPDDAVPRDPEVREHDPRAALYGGPDGLRVVRLIVDSAVRLLRPGGLLIIEHGDEQGELSSGEGVPAVIRAAETESGPAFAAVIDRPDLNGRPRFTMAKRVLQ
ncbi:MAG: peptide chain release factor N(5)-glutamine methyltransferase [Actinomycetes bacterium]